MLINFWGDEAILKMVGLWLIVFAQVVGAGEIYKWTDENGKVHFGDKSNAPKQSQEVIVNPVSGTGAMPSSYNFTPSPVNEEKNKTKEVAWDSPEAARCEKLAKQFITKESEKDRGAIGRQIKAICPNLRFQCYTSRSEPQTNRCVATKEDFLGGFIKETRMK